jgi:hypothetical protein
MRTCGALFVSSCLVFCVGCGGSDSVSSPSDTATSPPTLPTSPAPTLPSLSGTVHAFNFSEGAPEWSAGVSLYDIGSEAWHEFSSGYLPLPAPLDQSSHALYFQTAISLMYYKHQVTGLVPNGLYDAAFAVMIATPYSSLCIGMGDPPGGTVFYAGAASLEPRSTLKGSSYRLNVELDGSAGESGGSIKLGNSYRSLTADSDDACKVYELKALSSGSSVLRVRADENGALWLLIAAVDPSYTIAKLYITQAAAGFTPAQ